MIKENEALRYGTYLTDFYGCMLPSGKEVVRIRTISYEGVVYYHKMLNGVVVDFRKIGVVE